VEYIAVNTDMQDLEEVSAHKKIHIGRALTKGMGAGMNPDIGRQAVEENRSEIGEIIKGADIVFIAAGFGGGTGSGAAPVIAEIAKEAGVLTIGIVTRPFKFEGSKRMTIAQEAIDRIRENVDALVIIPNDRVFSVIDKDTSILKAFAYVDDVLKDGVGAIADLINVPGIINVDFSDIRTILKDMGTSMIGVGLAKGQDRSTKVIQQAVNSPLLETSIEGAKGVLFSIAGGRDLKMSEVNDIAKVISDSLDPNAQVIFGAINDNSLKDKAIKLTVIATGFNGALRDNNSFNMPHLFSRDEKRKSSFEINSLKADKDLDEESSVEEEENPFSNHQSGSGWESQGGLDEEDNDDSKSSPWDVPTFLRKKKKK
jgi:cell division protein FtsZ